MKVSIITLGCKQNKYESDCMARILLDAGYDVETFISVCNSQKFRRPAFHDPHMWNPVQRRQSGVEG